MIRYPVLCPLSNTKAKKGQTSPVKMNALYYDEGWMRLRLSMRTSQNPTRPHIPWLTPESNLKRHAYLDTDLEHEVMHLAMKCLEPHPPRYLPVLMPQNRDPNQTPSYPVIPRMLVSTFALSPGAACSPSHQYPARCTPVTRTS